MVNFLVKSDKIVKAQLYNISSCCAMVELILHSTILLCTNHAPLAWELNISKGKMSHLPSQMVVNQKTRDCLGVVLWGKSSRHWECCFVQLGQQDDLSYCIGLHHWTLAQELEEQEGFLPCQTLTSTVRLKVERCRVKNGGCRIKSEKWRV